MQQPPELRLREGFQAGDGDRALAEVPAEEQRDDHDADEPGEAAGDGRARDAEGWQTDEAVY